MVSGIEAVALLELSSDRKRMVSSGLWIRDSCVVYSLRRPIFHLRLVARGASLPGGMGVVCYFN